MQFSIFISAALMLGSITWASPVKGQDIETRNDHHVIEQARHALSENLQVRQIVSGIDFETRKEVWEKVSVSDNTGGPFKGGGIKQGEWARYKELARKALYEAGCEEGDVTNKEHGDDTSSQDKEAHITIIPRKCGGKSAGVIHVRVKNGNWTQGKGGNDNSGEGKGEECGRERDDYIDNDKKSKGKGGKKSEKKGGKKSGKT